MKKYQPGETASITEKWELRSSDWNADKVINEYISNITS